MRWPDRQNGLEWLVQQGLSEPEAQSLLMASGGRPEDAMSFAASGRQASHWVDFPGAMLRGDSAYVRDWSASELLDSLQKLCHDVMACKVGAAPRFFGAPILAATSMASFEALSAWNVHLVFARKTMDHPFNAGLMQESLVERARTALNSAA
jgi:DNA polymerase-3 subunit delta'